MYFEQISRDEITTFAMIFLQNSNYIKNPYLKSKFVEILFHFTHSLYQDASGRTFGKLDDVFVTHPLARESLVKCLMTFYVGKPYKLTIFITLYKLCDDRCGTDGHAQPVL